MCLLSVCLKVVGIVLHDSVSLQVLAARTLWLLYACFALEHSGLLTRCALRLCPGWVGCGFDASHWFCFVSCLLRQDHCLRLAVCDVYYLGCSFGHAFTAAGSLPIRRHLWLETVRTTLHAAHACTCSTMLRVVAQCGACQLEFLARC